MSLAVIASLALADSALAGPWLNVIVLSGDFESAREQLEHVRDAEDPALAVATIVLHDGPRRGDARCYEAHYCPRELRADGECSEGGAIDIPLAELVPGARQEVDLADPDTLAGLLAWAWGRYPADKVVLTLKGGAGLGLVIAEPDFDGDEVDGAGLTARGLVEALDARGALAGRAPAVDVLVLASSSSAAVETAVPLVGRVRFLVATQESTGDGRSVYFRLPVLLSAMRDAPALEPRDFARRVAWVYRDPSYASFDPELTYAISVVDVDVLPVLLERFTADVAALDDLGERGLVLLEEAAAGVWHFGSSASRVDLAGLLSGLEAASAAHGIDPPLGLRSRVALRSALVDLFASPEGGATGLSLFYPEDPSVQWDLREEYRRRCATFTARTGWQRLLKARLRRERDAAGGCAAAHGPAGLAPLVAMCLVALGARRRRSAGDHRHRPRVEP